MLAFLLSTVPSAMLGYFLYSGDYPRNFLLFIVAIAFLFIFYFGMVAPPEKTIYLYLFLWITIPKHIRFFPFLGTYDLLGVSIFDVIHTLAVLAIAVALMAHKGTEEKLPKSSWNFFILVLVMAFTTSFFSIILPNYWEVKFASEIEPIHRDIEYLFYGLIFFLGIMSFIKTMRQVEIIFAFFVISGIMLTIECILVFHLGLFPYLHSWAFMPAGNFQSLIFLSDNWVGQFSILAICGALYFYKKGGKKLWLALIPPFFIPILATYQKALLIGGVVSVGAFLYFAKPKKFTIYILLLVMAMLFAYQEKPELRLETYQALAGEVREKDYWHEGTLTSRFGSYLRTLDVFIYAFPFGVGEGMAQYYMSSSVPHRFDEYLPDDHSEALYWGMVSGEHRTSTHNLYLHFITEQGALGVLALISFIYLLRRNYRIFRHTLLKRYGFKSRINIALASVYAALLGQASFYLFDSAARLYFIFFLLFYLTFLLEQLAGIRQEKLASTRSLLRFQPAACPQLQIDV